MGASKSSKVAFLNCANLIVGVSVSRSVAGHILLVFCWDAFELDPFFVAQPKAVIQDLNQEEKSRVEGPVGVALPEAML